MTPPYPVQQNGSEHNGSQHNGSQHNGSQFNGSQFNGSQFNGSQCGSRGGSQYNGSHFCGDVQLSNTQYSSSSQYSNSQHGGSQFGGSQHGGSQFSTSPRMDGTPPSHASREVLGAPSRRGKKHDAEEQRLCRLDEALVRAGIDRRTTLHVANIPNKLTQRQLLALFETHHAGHIDFFYLPVDFKNDGNLGYCFVNFARQEYIPSFLDEFSKYTWGAIKSTKVCDISFGRLQGLAKLINRFRDSPVAREDPRVQPIIIHPQTGSRASFSQVNAELILRWGRHHVPDGDVVAMAMEVASGHVAAAAAATAARQHERFTHPSQAPTALNHQQRVAEQQQGMRLARGPLVGEQAHAQAAQYLSVGLSSQPLSSSPPSATGLPMNRPAHQSAPGAGLGGWCPQAALTAPSTGRPFCY